MRISTNIAIVPFSHPIRLAEDLAVLDQLSGGRIEFGAGLGYAPHEFQAFGFPVSHRVSRTEECLDILRLAWSGERFSYHGKRYEFDDVRGDARPGPARRSAAVAGDVERAERRAGRALRHQRAAPGPGVAARLAGARRPSRPAADPTLERVGIIRSFLVTDDPERDWPPLRAAERYRMAVYGGFFEAAGLGNSGTFNELERITQRVFVGNVAECVTELTAYVRRYGLTDVVTWGSAPGLQPAALTPSMERFAAEVVPQVRAALAAPDAVAPAGGTCLWAGSVPEGGRLPAAERFPPRSGDRRDYSSSGVARGPKMNRPSGIAGSAGRQSITMTCSGLRRPKRMRATSKGLVATVCVGPSTGDVESCSGPTSNVSCTGSSVPVSMRAISRASSSSRSPGRSSVPRMSWVCVSTSITTTQMLACDTIGSNGSAARPTRRAGRRPGRRRGDRSGRRDDDHDELAGGHSTAVSDTWYLIVVTPTVVGRGVRDHVAAPGRRAEAWAPSTTRRSAGCSVHRDPSR